MSLEFRTTVGLAAGVTFVGLLTICFIGVCIWAAQRRRRVRALKQEAAANKATDRRMVDLEVGHDGAPSSVPLSKGSSATSTMTTGGTLAAATVSHPSTSDAAMIAHSPKKAKPQNNDKTARTTTTTTIHANDRPPQDQIDHGC